MAEKHPWSEDYVTFYKEYENPTIESIRNISLEQIQQFRQESKNWATNRRVYNNVSYASKTFETSNDWPNHPFALYSVVTNLGESLILTPVHCEIAADDRADLQIIRLTLLAFDLLNRGGFNFKKYPIGCIICVTKLQMIEGRNLEDISFHSDINEKPCWEVSHFFPCKQQFIDDVITIPYEHSPSNRGHFKCVTSEYSNVMRYKSKIPRKTMENGYIWQSKIFKPWTEPNIRLSGYRGRSDCRKRFNARISTLLKEHKLLPSIVDVKKAAAEKLKMFEQHSEAFGHYCCSVAMRNIEEVVFLGENGGRAIRNDIDRNTYPITVDQFQEQNQWILFNFELPRGSNNAPLLKWNKKQRIRIIYCDDQSVNGEIVGAVLTDSTITVNARILHKLSRKFRKMIEDGPKKFEVQQKKDCMPIQIRKWNEKVENGSNGDSLIKALYGGQQIKPFMTYDIDPMNFELKGKRFLMSRSQAQYVDLFTNPETSAFLGAASFGCGVTTTMAMAAIHMSRKFQGINVVVAPNEIEAVQFINMLEEMDPSSKIHTVRLISKKRRRKMEMEKITEVDYPYIFPIFFQRFILGKNEEQELSDELANDISEMMNICIKKRLLSLEKIRSQKLRELFQSTLTYTEDEEDEDKKCFKLYLKYSEVKIIVATAQFLIDAFSSNRRNTNLVTTVQIDKAPSLSQATLCQLAVLFQRAKFSLVGDLQEHQPHFDQKVCDVLKDATTGITMKHLIDGNCLPVVYFHKVFRCDGVITKMLGTMFYKDRLRSQQDELEINRQLRDEKIIPATSYPIAFVHTDSSYEGDESLLISKENEITKALVQKLLQFVEPESIGLLCFFENQKNTLHNWAYRTRVNLLMVDEAQGREFDIVLVLITGIATNRECQDLNDAFKIKVALTRSKGTVFVLGKVFNLRKLEHFSKIIWKSSAQSAVCDIRKSKMEKFPDGTINKVIINFDWNEIPIESPRKRQSATESKKRKNQETDQYCDQLEEYARIRRRRGLEEDAELL